MEYNKKGPFIHLFQTPLGYYFYDVNTNQIIKINNDIYTILQNYTEECKNNEQILKLYEAGANYAQTECQFRYCGTAIPFLTVRSTAR